MKCPKCAGESIMVRMWEVCFYNAYMHCGEVTETKHTETCNTGYTRDCHATCEECGFDSVVGKFLLNEYDIPPSIPIIVPDRETFWERLRNWRKK